MKRIHATILVTLAGSLIGLILLCLSTDGTGYEVPPVRVCERRLERIGEAIIQYCDDHGALPAVSTSSSGEQVSWRVLIAPYLMRKMDGRKHLDYSLDQPWHSPHNRDQFYRWLPCVLSCPMECENIEFRDASYLMLVRDSLHDGREVGAALPSDAVIVVESTSCGIECAEPRDLLLEDLFRGDSAFGVGKLNSFHPEGVRALRVDGRVIWIPRAITQPALRKLLAGSQ